MVSLRAGWRQLISSPCHTKVQSFEFEELTRCVESMALGQAWSSVGSLFIELVIVHRVSCISFH
jgi:hypothetical protein